MRMWAQAYIRIDSQVAQAAVFTQNTIDAALVAGKPGLKCVQSTRVQQVIANHCMKGFHGEYGNIAFVARHTIEAPLQLLCCYKLGLGYGLSAGQCA